MIENLINYLKENGWYITSNDSFVDVSNNDVLKHFENLSPLFIKLMANYKKIISKDETVWFLCLDDYNDSSESAFKWNEFELLSLEATAGDEQWEKEIREWWADKLPIILSVGGEYSYYAIDAGKDGAIIYGYEPEFEEEDVVADNFEDFINKLINGVITL